MFITQLPVINKKWSGRRDSNSRQSAWKAEALANWATPATFAWWWEKDSNLRSRRRRIYSPQDLTTLQPHRWKYYCSGQALFFKKDYARQKMELVKGVEPPTCWLQISCSSQLSYTSIQTKWWFETESNCRHKDFQSFALPTELSNHANWSEIIQVNLLI